MLRFQIGKAGLTPGIVESLNLALKHHKQIRISVLKSSGRDRKSIIDMADKIVSSVEDSCEYKIIGFTIILIKKSESKIASKLKSAQK